jgi:prephenate dehydratase
MHSLWVKGLRGPDKEQRVKEVLSYRNAFDDLREILEQHYVRKEAVRDYSPGWEYKQIANNEYNAALDDLINLIDLNRKDQ